MITIIRYTLLTAMRDWLFIGLFIIILMAYALSNFMGSTALSEQEQMSLAYFAGISRMVLVIGIVVFICFHVRRAFENREIESTLSKPISRTVFVVAYWLGFAILALLAVLPVLLIASTLNVFGVTGLLYWGMSLVFEISIIVAFALLASLIMSSAVSSVLSTFAFYLISRLMGFFLLALDAKDSLMTSGEFGSAMGNLMVVISTVIPRLDLFAKSEWLIYGIEDANNLWLFPVQTAIFVPLLLAIAVYDFKRKQF